MRKEQQIGRALSAGLLVAGLAFGLAIASAQSALPAGPGGDSKAPGTLVAGVVAEAGASASVLRTIDDPETGHRWLLMRNAEHPGGPGKLVLSTDTPARTAPSGAVSSAGVSTLPKPLPGSSSKTALAPASAPQPQIRAGDHLLVEEHSSVVDAQLTAVALGPAMLGSVFNARLEIGGRVVRVVADRPGHASFAVEKETRP